MQFNLFDDDALEDDLERDNVLHLGALFRLERGKYAVINKREGINIVSKSIDADGILREINHPVAHLPILPLEVLCWDDDVFFVRLLYRTTKGKTVERIVSLAALKDRKMPLVRSALSRDGMFLSQLEWERINRSLVEILRVGTARGAIPIRKRVSRREWCIKGPFLERRIHQPALSLVHSSK